ncbi:CAP domain-containing protein [Thiohalomonas denitrificans]|uniref:CAP domain-containing protein n=1 Tax=Thiohalomonas denitrificans TaxID=415747 RepID=UPI0026F09E4C|nr:CAP domain-containing protein [Thiohalomonas denitrificans]
MKTAYIAVWILTTALWWPTIVLAEGLVDPESMLSEHNAIRSQHELPPLRWSPSLAEDAAAWADHLAEQESCRMVHGESGQGENLFWASPRRWSDGRTVIQPIEPEEVVQHWAAEQAFYDYATNTCRSGEQCGHYTQIVWEETEEVGCAKRICPDQSQLWVCRYHPPGNVVGRKPY